MRLSAEMYLKNRLFLSIGDPSTEVQHRGVVIVSNMMRCSKEVAETLIATDVMEILLALTLLPDDGKEVVRKIATKALQSASEWKLIRKPEQNDTVDVSLE